MIMRSTLARIALLAGLTGTAAADFAPLSQACEEALALSALPADLRDKADVYVWRDGEFARTIDNGGGFHCLVERNHPDAIIPECVTASGKDTIFAGLVYKTKLAAQGLSAEEQDAKLNESFANGELQAPPGPGINYMMSAYNYIYIASRDEIRTIPPHTMFFAPEVTADVVGASFEAAVRNPGSPFITASSPHGYMITFTAESSEREQVRQACNGEIDTEGWQAAAR